MPNILPKSLEFSPKLGVRQLPQIDDHHQSNVRGIYVVGDLADAPIIKVALRQGYDVARHVAETLGSRGDAPEVLDVLIVGGGPAGIGAALACEDQGLRYAVLEREAPFATIQNFPKAKLIFSEPHEVDTPGGFWFEDATTEDLVARWSEALDQHGLRIQQPEEVLGADRRGGVFEVRTQVGDAGLSQQVIGSADAAAGANNTYRARRIILAAGKRGQVRRLGIDGEDLPHVHHALKDATPWAEKRVLVVGGGDSAVEAACDLADAGAQVIVSYRGDSFYRAKLRNRSRIDALTSAGRLEVLLGSKPLRFDEDSTSLQLSDGQTRDVPTEGAFIFVGTRLPLAFLRRLGVKMKGDLDALRAAWIVSFAALTYLFYVLKSGVRCAGGEGADCAGGSWVAKKAFFPFGPEHPLAWLPDLLHVDLGFRVVDGSFWGTTAYAVIIAVFGVRAMRRYPLPEQQRRYRSLIAFQWIFLFGVPELLAPLIIDRGWRLYGLSVPWPLNIWALIDSPHWLGGATTENTVTALLWIGLGAVTSFVLVPLYVRRNGVRFCSYLCGCGGLAETLGDLWRHLAPRGRHAKQAEWFGRVVLVLAVPVTLLILNDAWAFFASDALYSTKAFAEHWYGLMVDFWLASVVGVALYPYLGNRVWCRFFCPLRAYMEELAKRLTRIVIKADSRCIGCGECTRYCQMGIEVQRFAQNQELMSNHNSACIQCGICIQVCPMNVLEVGEVGDPVELRALDTGLRPPRADWQR